MNILFRYVMKQQGGLLAKGLLGIQFLTLFENNLYTEISQHADDLAEQIRETLHKGQVPFLIESHTNQIFPILSDAVIEKLREKYSFDYQGRIDGVHSAVRICTSWATDAAAVEQLCNDLIKLLQAE